MRERDQGGHLRVGAGIPTGPDSIDEPAGDGAAHVPVGRASDGDAPDGHAPDDAARGDHAADPRTSDGEASDEMVQAVADFVDDLVLDDPTGDQVDGAAAHRSGDVTA